jgi:hypothetical protein
VLLVANNRWTGIIAIVGLLVVSSLPAVAAASPSGNNRTMRFTAKLCHATVRDLPNTARIDPYAGPNNLDKGQLVYGTATPHTRTPNTLSFTCVHGAFSSLRFGELLSDGGCSPSKAHPVYLGDPGKVPMQPLCKPYGSTSLAGTNINWVEEFICGAAGGSGRSTSGCGHSLTYILKLHGAFVVLDTVERGSSPSPWVVNMLQHSTFHVDRGAGGNPDTPFAGESQKPQDWTLPNNWLLDGD